MLTVIKKDLRKQKFAPDKIRISVASSADDVNFMLNKKDLDMVTKDAEKKIISLRGIDGQTSSYEIRCVVYETLRDLGFNKVANSYYNHCNN